MSATPVPPVVGSFAEEWYTDLLPVAWEDHLHQWALRYVMGGLGDVCFQEISDLVRDTVLGPGWSPAVDLDRVPDKGLGYLGQFAGVALRSGLDDAQQRDWIRATSNMRRGTLTAMIGAATPYLTGSQTVIVKERFGGPTLLQPPLDMFNRANAAPPLSAQLTSPLWSGDGNFKIISNHVAPNVTGQLSSVYWNATNWTDSQVKITTLENGVYRLAVRIQNPANTGTMIGYYADFDLPNDRITFYRLDAGMTAVQLLQITTPLAAGDQIALAAVGNQLIAYVNQYPEFHGWLAVGATRDTSGSAHSGAGRIGMRAQFAWDDFGGGLSGEGPGAYRIQFKTYADETPDPTAVLRALISQKPAALFLDYRLVKGQTYETLRDFNTDYTQVSTKYTNYEDARDDTPHV